MATFRALFRRIRNPPDLEFMVGQAFLPVRSCLGPENLKAEPLGFPFHISQLSLAAHATRVGPDEK